MASATNKVRTSVARVIGSPVGEPENGVKATDSHQATTSLVPPERDAPAPTESAPTMPNPEATGQSSTAWSLESEPTASVGGMLATPTVQNLRKSKTLSTITASVTGITKTASGKKGGTAVLTTAAQARRARFGANVEVKIIKLSPTAERSREPGGALRAARSVRPVCGKTGQRVSLCRLPSLSAGAWTDLNFTAKRLELLAGQLSDMGVCKEAKDPKRFEGGRGQKLYGRCDLGYKDRFWLSSSAARPRDARPPNLAKLEDEFKFRLGHFAKKVYPGRTACRWSFQRCDGGGSPAHEDASNLDGGDAMFAVLGSMADAGQFRSGHLTVCPHWSLGPIIMDPHTTHESWFGSGSWRLLMWTEQEDVVGFEPPREASVRLAPLKTATQLDRDNEAAWQLHRKFNQLAQESDVRAAEEAADAALRASRDAQTRADVEASLAAVGFCSAEANAAGEAAAQAEAAQTDVNVGPRACLAC